jgi:PAS domain S-box-containing protein
MRNESDTPSTLYQLLVENSLGLMCIHDLDGVLLSVNPAVPASLGYPPRHGPGRNLGEFLAPEFRHLFDAYLRRIRRDKKESGLMRLQASDGSERIWMYRNALYAPEGADPVVLGHALDITDRVQAERALREAKAELRKANEELARRVEERTAELQEANRRLSVEIEQRTKMEEELLRRRNLESLGTLAGGIAHQFNNFLTVVQGNVALARMRPGVDRAVGDLLEEIAGACERTAFLASQLLTFAKGGAPVRRAVPMAGLVRDAVNLVRTGSPVSVHVDLAPDLWSADIDPGQIGQALHNIVLNAREAAPAGGMIEVTAANVTVPDGSGNPTSCVRIAVRDYGGGIAAEVLPRIFDPYFTTKPRSSGLGLTSAYSIVRKHGGLMSVTSQPGQGTLVTIDLPASQAEPAVPPEEPPAAGDHRWKLLVMDDEASIRRLLKSVLSARGHDVTCVSDGAEAIALYEAAKAAGRGYDAVLLDLTVKGGMGGVDAAARLKEMDPGARLIVSSGYSDSPVLSEFRKFGFDEILHKPWAPGQVAEAFRSVLARQGVHKRR